MIRKDDFPLWEVHIKKKKKMLANITCLDKSQERSALGLNLKLLIMLDLEFLLADKYKRKIELRFLFFIF